MLCIRMLLMIPFSFNIEHTTKLQTSLAEYQEGQSPELGFLIIVQHSGTGQENHVPHVAEKWNTKVIQALGLKEDSSISVSYNSP